MPPCNSDRSTSCRLMSVASGLTAQMRAIAAVIAIGVLGSGCVQSTLEGLEKSSPEISSKVLAEMSKKHMTPQGPVLVRLFKEESELEIWKRDATGKFALLKTFPICRWSGKLGPKKTDGDRQAPEGFYRVTKGMLNPKSQFYLSFNLGYPNKLETALGYRGTALMVHGACSSSGCYALTDQGVGEIYAIVSKALDSGQSAFQVQAFPFRMTASHMAEHRDDPNFEFWKTLKAGYDRFEVTRQEPSISVCGGRYVADAQFEGGEPTNPLMACPARTDRPNPLVASRIDAENAELSNQLKAGSGTHLNSYSDGSMHRSFRALLKRDGPEKLAAMVSKIDYPISRPQAALADPLEVPAPPAAMQSEPR